MKVINILNGRCLVVELPEGASNPRIEGQHLTYNISHDDEWGYDYNAERLPQGNWKIVGMLPEVTEEQSGMLVAKVMNGQHHQNYNYKSVIERWVKTALESLESSILAEGWCFENLYVHPKEDKMAEYSEPFDSNGFYQSALKKWQQAQSRVLDRSRCLLLGREI